MQYGRPLAGEAPKVTPQVQLCPECRDRRGIEGIACLKGCGCTEATPGYRAEDPVGLRDLPGLGSYDVQSSDDESHDSSAASSSIAARLARTRL